MDREARDRARSSGYRFGSHRCGNFRAVAERCGIPFCRDAIGAALRLSDATGESTFARRQRTGPCIARAREMDRDGAGTGARRSARGWLPTKLLAAAKRKLHIASEFAGRTARSWIRRRWLDPTAEFAGEHAFESGSQSFTVAGSTAIAADLSDRSVAIGFAFANSDSVR